MVEKKKRFHIFAGWWMVLITAIMTGTGVGFVGQGISVIFKPLAAELGLSRAATSLATGLGRLQGGLEGPFAGWLSDRYGPRYIIVAGLCFFISGLVLMHYINAPWQYYVFWGVMIGIGHNLALTISIDKALSDWFVAKRGLAFGIRFSIIGVCQIIVVPIVTWLVIGEGWRTTCLIWAIVMSAGIPITLLFVKAKRPEYYGLLPDGFSAEQAQTADQKGMLSAGTQYAEGFEEQEYTVRQALKTRAFWMMLFAWSMPIMVMSGFTIHVVPFLTDMGISQTMAGAMLSMMIFFMIPSRFTSGFLADRIRKDRLQYIGATSVLLQGLGLTAFLLHQSVATAFVLLITYGLGNGAVTPVRLSMGARYFGRKAFASIMGVGMFINAPLGFLAPIYTGWIYDIRGSYTIAFMTYAILLFCAMLVLLLLRPPAAPGQVSDISKVF
jgi:MFS family permease